MRFLIISHAPHYKENNQLFSYAPYVREMNLWLKYVDEVEIVAPLKNERPTKIDLAHNHDVIRFSEIPEIALTSILKIIKSLIVLPLIFFKIFSACKRADHIHLRCPGNIGLLGCLVQIFFPNKVKTAKYAGNWDPNASQPRSYRIQKWLLSNVRLTKNMTVLAYGKWQNQSKNIKSFFTATYTNNEIVSIARKDYSRTLNFLFIGSLVVGKRPMFAIQVIETLQKKNINCRLDVFGDGPLRKELEHYILRHQIKNIKIHGNQTKETLKNYIEKSHFLILASKSEGWPKVLAEAMFFGVIPVSTKISCVPYMLGEGTRGLLIDTDLNRTTTAIIEQLKDETKLVKMSKEAQEWSQRYTLDYFESEIKKLITK